MRFTPTAVIAPAIVALAFANPAAAQKKVAPRPGLVRVQILTDQGPITLALEARRAPETTKNFLEYVDDGRFDGAVIYRSAKTKNATQYGFIQGGIRTDARRILPPFKHERTDRTGIRHTDGTISMARRTEPNSAGGNFFITLGALPSFDAKGEFPGYAAFGHVVGGMPVVKRIHDGATGGRMGGQMLMKPVRIISAKRLDGPTRPTGMVKPWLIERKKPS